MASTEEADSQVNLDKFHTSMDLLLHLAKRDEIDLNVVRTIDVEQADNFLVLSGMRGEPQQDRSP